MNKKSTNTQVDWGNAHPSHWSVKTGLIITDQNRLVYLCGIGVIGLITITAIAGIIILAYQEKEVPQSLVAIGSAGIGALGGLFASSK